MSVHAATALAFGSKVKLRNPMRCGHIRCRGEAHRAQEDRTVCQAAEAYAWRPRLIRASAFGSGHSSSLPSLRTGRRPKHRFLLEHKE